MANTDLSIVDKQTVLVAMDRQMLGRHAIVITDVLCSEKNSTFFALSISDDWLLCLQQTQRYF